MEPCRSSTKSKRRSADENNEAHDCNNNVRSAADDASQPLLGEDNGSSSSSDELLTEPNSELCHSGSSFEAAIKAADRVTSSFSETTAPMNNCSTSTQTGSSKSKSSSSKWRYPFRSERRPIIDAMDILGKETVRGLKGAKLPLTSSVLDGAKNKFTKSQKEGDNNPSSTISSPPITSITLLENGLFVTASKSHKNIKLWKFKEQVVSVPPTQGKDDDSVAQHHDIDNNIVDDKRNEIEFICEFRGHVSGVTTMVKLDKRGRFLTASLDKSVKLWEIDCKKDDDDGIRNGPNLLATFTNLDKRWIKVSITTMHLLFPFRYWHRKKLTNTHHYSTSVLYLLTKAHSSDQLMISTSPWSRQWQRKLHLKDQHLCTNQ